MPSKQNITALEQVKASMAKSKSFVLADYKGLNVSQLTKLRGEVAKAGGELKVNKNTLVKLALKAGDYPLTEVEKDLVGPTATVFSYDDEISVIKAVSDFAKENGLPKLKSGFLGSNFLSAGRLELLASLPNKEVLLGQVVGTIAAPLSGLVNVMQGNLRKLVYVLQQVQSAKGKVQSQV